MDGGGERLSFLNRDVMAHILARVDGPTLASASCTRCEFNEIAKEDGLWEKLCNSTWPSTVEENVKNIISSSHGGFGKFYANSFPFILYNVPVDEEMFEAKGSSRSCPATSELVSLIDVYYKQNCIFSKALYGISGAAGNDEMYNRWFMDGPFKLDALKYYHCTKINDDDEIGEEDDEMGDLPTLTVKRTKKRGTLCRKLEEKVRLSWVILNTSTGQSVNLSSWKPLSIQQHWPLEGEVLMHFGSLVAGDDGRPIECVISVICRVLDKKGSLQWREISMQMEDNDGTHIDGRKSLKVLQRALTTNCRSRKHEQFDKIYKEFLKNKKDAMKKRMRKDYLVEKLIVCTGIALFVSFCHLLIS